MFGKTLLSEMRERISRWVLKVRTLETFLLGAMQETKDLRERMDSTESLLIRQGEELERMRRRQGLMEDTFVKTDAKVGNLDRASGGTWRTASGHTLRIRDMSDNHIKRCLGSNFPGPGARANMEREMQRRKEEEHWRKQPMPGGTSDGYVFNNGNDPETDEDVDLVGYIDGTPVYVDENLGALQRGRIRTFIQRAKEARLL